MKRQFIQERTTVLELQGQEMVRLYHDLTTILRNSDFIGEPTGCLMYFIKFTLILECLKYSHYGERTEAEKPTEKQLLWFGLEMAKT